MFIRRDFALVIQQRMNFFYELACVKLLGLADYHQIGRELGVEGVVGQFFVAFDGGRHLLDPLVLNHRDDGR